MPPDLVLLAGWLFVINAFRTQKKRGVVAPPGLFWPTIWYLMVSSRMLGIWLVIWHVPLPGSSGDATEGSPVDGFFFLFLIVMALITLARRHFDWGQTTRLNPWVTALFAFMAMSILWSKYPYVSFKRYIKVVGSVTMALVVLTNENPTESIYTVLRRTLYIHFPMDIITIKYFRDIGVSFDWSGTSRAWQGISTSKNDLGQVAMLGVLYFSYELVRNWKTQRWKNLNMIYLLMALYLIKGSEDEISMTSVSAAAVALLVFARLQFLRRQLPLARRFVKRVFFALTALVTLILVHSVVMFSEGSIFGFMITKFGRNITLTDRTFIWHDVYAAASGNPLLGVGFGGFWIGRIANIPWAEPMSWVLGQAHNGYIDTYLQIGLIGGGLLAAVIFSTLPRLLGSMESDFDLACFRLTLFVTILFVNVTESTFLRGDHHLWFITQLVIWIFPTQPSASRVTGRTDAASGEARPMVEVYT